MFTGIIQTIGHIHHIQAFEHTDYAGLQLTVQANAAFMVGVTLGDSIAIQGACMTVVRLCSESDSLDAVTGFVVDVSYESLSKTTGLNLCGQVNLEKAVSLSTPLGGHLVTGHVDGLGQVVSVQAVGESWQLIVNTPLSMAKFFAVKGSAVINGVSLTVNSLEDQPHGCHLSFNLIPHTWQHTTLSQLKQGDLVNLEIDLVARYLQRMLTAPTVDVNQASQLQWKY